MSSLSKLAAVAGILITTVATVAAAPRDAVTPERRPVLTKLSDDASAMTFWVDEPGGWRVITVVDTVIGRESPAEQHAIVRFSSILLPGQSQLISVPSSLGEQSQNLRISRVADGIEVTQVPGI